MASTSTSPIPTNGSAEAPTLLEEFVTRPYGKVVLSLDNVLLPPEKTDPSPSRADGLDEKSECELRFLGCELIQTAGMLLKVPQVAMASGQVLFQRFYYSKSFVRMPMEHTAMASICLASKIEEAPRRIRDIVNVFHHIRQVRAGKKISPLILDQNYINLKNQIIKAERRILKELGFCVHVKHPHKLIVTYLNLLKQEKNPQLMQLCWNYMNDSLRSDVFVRYTPEAIACACIFLGGRQIGVPLPKDPQPWYELFDVSTPEVLEIADVLLDLYRIEKPDLEKLEQHVAELERTMKEAKVKARILAGGLALSAGNTPIGAGMSGGLSPQTSFSNNPSPSNAVNKEGRSSSEPTADNHVDIVEEINRVNNNNEKENDGPDGKEEKRKKRRSSSRSESPVQKRRRRSGSERNGHRSRSRQLENGKSSSRSRTPSEASSSDRSPSPAKERPKSYSRDRSKDRKSSSRRKEKRDKRHRSRSRDKERNSRHRHHRSRHGKKDKGRSVSRSLSVTPPRRRDDRREGKSKSGRVR